MTTSKFLFLLKVFPTYSTAFPQARGGFPQIRQGFPQALTVLSSVAAELGILLINSQLPEIRSKI